MVQRFLFPRWLPSWLPGLRLQRFGLVWVSFLFGLLFGLLFGSACTRGGGENPGTFGTGTDSGSSGTTDPGTFGTGGSEGSGSGSGSGSATGGPTSGSGGSTGSVTGPKFDVDATAGTGGDPPQVCKVGPDGDARPCQTVAPADSFSPDLQWFWNGDGTFRDSIATPLVANLTDDNNDGEIDLCDIPDVVVVVNEGLCTEARIYVLDGATGAVHYSIDGGFTRASTPALGDIDDDGIPEIVAQAGSGGCSGTDIAVYEHDGTFKWQSDVGIFSEHSIALADMDNDGDVEILTQRYAIDHLGTLVFEAADSGTVLQSALTAVDLDGDDDLEMVLGRSAWHHDGAEYWFRTMEEPGQPAIADLDDDGRPEVLSVEPYGFSIYEHDGTVKVPSMNPTGDNDWRRPAAIHDVDGDDAPEFLVSSQNSYSAFEADATKIWSATVSDFSGLASGTAFDFLGDGVAEAIYGDEQKLWIFDGKTGAVVLQASRTSVTITEYPVVADVDNDGSSEIVVVTNGNPTIPTVQVYRDADDRWIQSRRIWNQHSYHVTNVREDGTIPQFERPHWEQLNTFRTNAQIESGTVCEPEG